MSPNFGVVTWKATAGSVWCGRTRRLDRPIDCPYCNHYPACLDSHRVHRETWIHWCFEIWTAKVITLPAATQWDDVFKIILCLTFPSKNKCVCKVTRVQTRAKDSREWEIHKRLKARFIDKTVALYPLFVNKTQPTLDEVASLACCSVTSGAFHLDRGRQPLSPFCAALSYGTVVKKAIKNFAAPQIVTGAASLQWAYDNCILLACGYGL